MFQLSPRLAFGSILQLASSFGKYSLTAPVGHPSYHCVLRVGDSILSSRKEQTEAAPPGSRVFVGVPGDLLETTYEGPTLSPGTCE